MTTPTTDAYLDIEDNLDAQLLAMWSAYVGPINARVLDAVQRGDLRGALKMADSVNFHHLYTHSQQTLLLFGMMAMVFGASRIVPPKKSIFQEIESADDLRDERDLLHYPKELLRSTTLLERMLATTGASYVQAQIKDAIGTAHATIEREGELPQKAAVQVLQTGAKAGQRILDTYASLHISRLAQMGFLMQAEQSGLTHYMVSEELDDRTCPVCMEMHGKVFTVAEAKYKLDLILSLQDPKDLKTAAPWPRQDRDSLKALRGMERDELQARGWDTPPYHPNCRGILVNLPPLDKSH